VTTALLLLSLLGQTPSGVSLVFGGDVIPHDPVRYAARMHATWAAPEPGLTPEPVNAAGWGHVFGPLAPVFKAADLAVVNLETPIVTVAHPQLGEMVFHAGPDLLEGLKENGVSIATFANNHCRDQGTEGILTTRSALAEVGLLTAGAGADAQAAGEALVVRRKGLRVGFVAFTRWLNGFQNPKDARAPQVPLVPYAKDTTPGEREDDLVARVRAAAGRVDALFVVVHWGDEYRLTPRPEDRALAQRLLDAGALAVIGHHPHVLQAVEWVPREGRSDGLVAWSLGNLVSNQDFDDPAGLKRDGLLLRLDLTRDAPGSAVRIAAVEGVPTWTENRVAPGKGRNVQPVVLDEECAAISERLAELPAAARGERAKLTRRLALLERTRARIRQLLPQGPQLGDARPARSAATPSSPTDPAPR
jgi:poly-gamma-glutamate synthesis protein (capsule biosynthesis protein)